MIFLSDGECILGDETIHDLCRTSARLGYASQSRSRISLTFALQQAPGIAHNLIWARTELGSAQKNGHHCAT